VAALHLESSFVDTLERMTPEARRPVDWTMVLVLRLPDVS
jgi:hypothetical protein